MSTTTVKLLEAAAEVVGGKTALARHLRIGEALLASFMADRRELPDRLLLVAVDIILEKREDCYGLAGCRPSLLEGDDMTQLLEGDDLTQNCARENGAASEEQST